MLASKKKIKKRKFIFGLAMGLIFMFSTYSVSIVNFWHYGSIKSDILSININKADEVYFNSDSNLIVKNTAKAADVGSNFFPSNWAGNLLLTVLEVIFRLSLYLLGWAMKLLDFIISPELFESAIFNEDGIKGINEGWKVLRDFLNMFFILMLLLVALGTILRVPKFSDKKVIFSIIAAALLINFSKAIALVIVDISQLAMSFFSSLIQAEKWSFASSMLNQINLEGTLKQGEDVYMYFIEVVTSTIFILVMAFMIGIIAVTLLIRLVAFYVLIILSPLAMFGLALPGTALSEMKKNWFTKITKWAFFGPIMVFFLWLAFVVINAITGGLGIEGDWVSYSSSEKDSLIGILVPYVAAIYLLFYGYDQATKFSIGAANKLLKWGDKKMGEWGKKIGSGSKNVALFPVAVPARKLRSLSGGFRDKDRKAYNPLGWVRTKTKRDEIKKEKDEKNRARGAGGDEFNRFEREKAIEKAKKWDDSGGLSTKEKTRIDKNGSSIDKKAKALWEAENKKFKTAADFEKAINSTGKGKEKDKVLEAKIRREAKKENLHAMMEYDVQEADKVLNSGDGKAILESTKDNPVLKMSVDAENERLKSLGKTELNDTEKVDYILGTNKYDAGGSRFDNINGKKFKGGFAGLHGRRFSRNLKTNTYQEKLDSMTDKEITSQGVELFQDKPGGGDSETIKYFKDSVGSGKRFKNVYAVKRAFSKQNSNKQTIARNKGIIP